MATATCTPTASATLTVDGNSRYPSVYGTLAVQAAAATYETGGLTCSFAGKVPFSSAPVRVEVWSETPANGFAFQFAPGTTIANGKLIILSAYTVTSGTSPGGVEMTNTTAIPAAISGDTKLRFKATFTKGK